MPLKCDPGGKKGHYMPMGTKRTRKNTLGSKKTVYKFEGPDASMLETFPNPDPGRQYTITLECAGFTSLCPKTGQPDHGKINIQYTPKDLCVETKSLKLYLFAFRNHGSFMEALTNKIRRDLVSVLKPMYLQVEGDFASRGDIKINVVSVSY